MDEILPSKSGWHLLIKDTSVHKHSMIYRTTIMFLLIGGRTNTFPNNHSTVELPHGQIDTCGSGPF
jgi:hypothetical protein